ncbi:MAG: hypothetical protein R3B54_16300 [Bdellovibrionota bacterium]
MKRTRKIAVYGLMVLSLVLSSCASELSEQDREREQAILEFERLSAAKGTYSGLLDFDGEQVPCTLNVMVQYNPAGNENKPLLQGTLRVGFFSGTHVSSRESSFNFSNSELKFIFPSATGGIKTEVRGLLVKRGQLDVSLETPKGHRAHGVLYTENKPSFDYSPKQSWNLRISGEELADVRAVFQITQTFQQVESPPGSDLPEMLELEGAILFSHLAKTPNQSVSLIYSPLSRQIDVRFDNGTRLFFSNVALKDRQNQLFPKALSGQLITRDSRVYDLAAIPAQNVISPALLPQETYKGFFRADPSAPVFPTVAYLEYRGNFSKNPATFPFSLFPSMRLVVLVCSQEKKTPTLIKKSILDLASVEHLQKEAIFQTTRSSSNSENFIATYASDWSHIEGNFESSGSIGGVVRPVLSLSADPSIGFNGCDEFNGF